MWPEVILSSKADGDVVNVTDLCKTLDISTTLFYSDVLPKLLPAGIPRVQFVEEENKETAFVNDIGLIVIGKTKHGFPIKTKFTVSSDDRGVHLTPLA